MKATFAGFPVDQFGPVYFNIPNPETDQSTSGTANKSDANKGDASGSGTKAPVTQQLDGEKPRFSTTTPKTPPSAPKIITPATKQFLNNVNYHVGNAI